MKKFFAIILLVSLLISSVPQAFAYETLKPGSKGQDVLDARMQLYNLGYFNKVPTQTEYTNNMKDYVKKFEKDYGLKQDGILSPEDQEVLFGNTVSDSASESEESIPNDQSDADEIRFQGIPWRSSAKETGQILRKSGFLDSDISATYGDDGLFILPNDDPTFSATSFSEPDGFFPDGGYSSYVTPLKTIGGHDAHNVILSFINEHKNGKIYTKNPQFISARIEFFFTESLALPDLVKGKGYTTFIDLLEKLEKQYGEFDRYTGKDCPINIRRALKQHSGNWKPNNSKTALAQAVKLGPNHTVLLLQYTMYHHVHLYYADVSAIEDVNALMDIIAPAPKEDAGL